MPKPLAICETVATLTEAVTPVGETGARISVQLITPGWGSSGYYSPQVLTEAANRKVFPAGTHMYLDHPTMTEAEERPERSVRDLAAVLTTDATVDATGGLVAEADVLTPYRQLIAEARDAIGVSIRAAGVAEQGEAEGRNGVIISAITEGLSADFVTHAGRGGRVLQLLESARARTLQEARNVGQWIESMIHMDFTNRADSMAAEGKLTREERIAMSAAIGDGLAAFVTSLENAAPQLYTRDLWDEPGLAAATVTEGAHDVPVDPAGHPTLTTESDEPPAAAALATETDVTAGTPPAALDETTEGGSLMGTQNTGQVPGTAGTPVVLGEAERLSQLLAESRTAMAEAISRADKSDQRAAAAERRATLVEAQRGAEVKAREALAKSDLKEAAWPDVITRVCDSLELTEAGKVDDAKLGTAIDAEIHAERTKVARLMEAYGVGTVAGLGGDPSGGEQFSEADFQTGMTDVFTSLGLSAEDAKTAAKGR
jgi:hypothetical protein